MPPTVRYSWDSSRCITSRQSARARRMRRCACCGKRCSAVALLKSQCWTQMPGCDGAQLGKLIAAEEGLRLTRRILLISSGQRGDLAELGFAGYLLKPVTQRDLMD